MEDLTMLCADCVVISCCCQCLILQILIFVFLRLPCKMFKKIRKYAKKKLQKKKRCEKAVHREMSEYAGDVVRIGDEHSFRIIKEEREFIEGRNSFGCCMEEVEKVMEELSQNGEFSFGSFWGRKGPWDIPSSIVTNDDGNDSVVRYQAIKMVNSFNCK